MCAPVSNFAALVAPAAAATCGDTDKGTHRRVVGALSLVGDQSTVNVAFKRDSDPRTFLFIF